MKTNSNYKYQSIIKKTLIFVSSLDIRIRRLILIIIDILIIWISFKFSFYVLKNENLPGINYYNLFYFHTFISISFYFFTGQYRGLTQYLGSKNFYKLIVRNLVTISFSSIVLLNIVGGLIYIDLSILLFGLNNLLMIFSRVVLRDLLIYWTKEKDFKKIDVVIYGAGSAGVQLSSILKFQGKFRVNFFIDDNPLLWNRNINGIQILPFSVLKKNKNIDRVILAIPSLNKNKRKVILSNLEDLRLSTFQIPTLDELSSSNIDFNDIKPIKIEDLLHRDIVPPIKSLIKKSINNNVICVTGAGGSIGSELCLQMLDFNPKKIILLERNELALYKIQKETEKFFPQIDICPVLGDCTNLFFIKRIFFEHKVNVIFHAAAYKHVPLVESNPFQALKNNILSTRVICEASTSVKAKLMMLISSDKAVRPTNVMGLSKRISELIVQAFAELIKNETDQNKEYTKFSMVRFGNVLGSSGSVLPLFQSQIDSGGPVTLTHPEIVRYFMTIPEAAQLVLQASQMSNGGDVFLLDMGEPVKIKDFAKKLIKLNGLTIKDKRNINGDIELVYTGLRPGEKLFEELLIDSKSISTEHPLIFKSEKNYIVDFKDFFIKLDEIQDSLENYKKGKIVGQLLDMVPEWNPSQEINF